MLQCKILVNIKGCCHLLHNISNNKNIISVQIRKLKNYDKEYILSESIITTNYRLLNNYRGYIS